LGGRKGIQSVKTEWSGAGMVICLGRGSDLHMAQLIPLPLTLLLQDIQIGFDFTFLLPAHLVSPGENPESRKMVVAVFVVLPCRREQTLNCESKKGPIPNHAYNFVNS